jgi:hypothetical protein
MWLALLNRFARRWGFEWSAPYPLRCGLFSTLADDNVALSIETCQLFCVAVGPADSNAIDSLGLTEPEVDAHIVVGEIAPSAAYFRNLLAATGFNFNACSNGISVTSRSFQSEADPVATISAIVPVEAGTIVDVHARMSRSPSRS